ncbi:MAG: glycoside hydrolase family 28 protein [Opitutaceae bacterium]
MNARPASPPETEASIEARLTGAIVPNREFRRLRARQPDARPGIQAAIDACGAAGGGRVVLDGGDHPCRGPLVLRSGVELHLHDACVVTFEPRPEYYLPPVRCRWAGTDCYNYSPFLYANGQSDIAITGRGRFEGCGEAWWPWRRDTRDRAEPILELRRMGEQGVPVERRIFGRPGVLRPPMFSPHFCRNVTVDGPTFRNSPFWTFCPTYCENVVVRNVLLIGEGCNTDGATADSCTDVLFEHVRVRVADDGFVLKSGYNRDGRRMGRPCRNVIMRGNEVLRAHTLLAIGSETAAGVENVFVRDCFASSGEVLWGVHLKSCPGRGGVVSNVDIRRIRFRTIAQNLLRINLRYAQNGPIGEAELPGVENVLLEDVECEGTGKSPLFIVGNEGRPVGRVELRRIFVGRSAAQSVIAHARDLHLEDVRIAPPPEVAALADRDFDVEEVPPGGRWVPAS